jgi:transposase-like protein
MKSQRRHHSAEFKAKVALEAIKGLRTTNEIAAAYGIHPVLLSQWKKQVLEELPQVFSSQRAKAAADEENFRDRLYQQIGQLQFELDWLKKKVGQTR